MSESEFVMHTPCPACGSSDANALHSDGHTYCHACTVWTPGEGQIAKELQPRKTLDNSFLIGESSAWRSRALTKETCQKWGIFLAKKNGKTVRVFNYRNPKSGLSAQKIRPRSKADMHWHVSSKEVGLYGQHLWRDGGKKLIITEGEIDAASVSQVQGHRWPVVSVPNGAQGAFKALKGQLEWIASFEEVVLMFDMDKPGRDASSECAALFKPGTCKIAHLHANDPNELLKAGKAKEIIDAIWGAKTYRPDGIVLGTDLWASLEKEEDVWSVPYPWQGLQEKTLGARLGEVITLAAGSGIGKSSVVRELAYHFAVTQGEKIGMLMFEETVKRTALGLMGIAAEKNFALMPKPQREEGYRDAFDTALGNVVLYDHFGSTSFDNVLERIRYMAKALDCKWIVLDHISILVSGMHEGDERRLIDNVMTSIKSVAMECNIGIFLVSHLKRPEGKGHEDGATTHLGQLRGSAAIGQLSDVVIGLERNQQSSKHANITTVRLLKNRPVGPTGVCGWLSYNQDTSRLTELLDDPTNEDANVGGDIF